MKKLPENDVIRLRHMLEAAEKALAFVADKTRASLDTDEKLQLALVRLVEIVGKAASHTTDAFQADHPQIPWAKITGMRNPLAHGYYDVNLDILWDTITEALPLLVAELKNIIESDEAS